MSATFEKGFVPGSARLHELIRADATAPSTFTTLEYDVVVPAALGETFAFFADASNLQRLTPPWLNFTILTPAPIVMRAGTEIDYRIRLYGVPMPWRTRIDLWEPGVRFVDRQLFGPYRWWRHEHRFEAVAHGTRVVDRVEYLPRARWISGAPVRRDVDRIFRYRQSALREIFRHQSQAAP
jgi:ligand-binding SRPBCC domain-containing protein